MILQFNTHGNEKQKACARAWADSNITDIVYGGSKGSAKSYTGVSLIFGAGALTYPGTHWFIARKKLNDLRKFTIPSIHEVFDNWGLGPEYYRYNGQDNYFELHNGSKVYLLDAKYMPSDEDYKRFGSMQMTGGWIEEAGEFEKEAKNNLSASIGRWKNDIYGLPPKLLQTCNPAKNYLYSDYYLPWKEGKLPHWQTFIQALPQDNKMLPDGYLEHLDRTLSENEKLRLLKGIWEFSSDPNNLFQYKDIVELWTNDWVPEDGRNRYISADIAYEGSDMFVLCAWSGLVLTEVVAMEKCSKVQVAKVIDNLRLKHHVPMSNVIYDADGLDTFVRQATTTGSLAAAKAFHNNGTPLYKENYKNLKAQCYWKLADLVSKHEIKILPTRDSKQIIQELEQIKQLERQDDTEPLRLEKKSDLKNRFGRSPDFADAIMMRMFFELRPKATNPANLSKILSSF